MTDKNKELPNSNRQHLSRRDFIKLSAAAGGSAALLGGIPKVFRALGTAESQSGYSLAESINQINTVCLQCNTGCGIKVKLIDGVAAKIDGNPYSPWTMWPHPAYNTPIKDLEATDGAICPKGQAGLQSVYDPYRIVSVLKRKPGTKRGGGEWISIPFDQAIQEVVDGGDLFGEGHVEGFKDLYTIKDPKIAKEMSAAVTRILDEKDAGAKKSLVQEFKSTYADHLNALIDPDHPDLGPKNNQFAFVWGRLKNGRGDLFKRFVSDSFGSVNASGHTTICQGSLYFTGKAMSEQFDPLTGKFSGGAKFYWQTDAGNSRFVIYVGANVFDANYGPPQRIPKITEKLVSGDMKYVVVDPRLSKAASKAWKWVPIKPGEDAALALGMIQWIIETGRYNAAFMSNANKAAAKASGEVSWTTGPWLVKIKDGKPGKWLRASEAGLVAETKQTDSEGKETSLYTTPEGKTFNFDPFVVLSGDEPFPFDPNNDEDPVQGSPMGHVTLNGIECKTGLQIIYEASKEHTISEWADIAGIKERDIIELADEFTRHGNKACVDMHRGVSQHTNGFYNVLAWYVLNCLVGNPDHQGGMIKGTTYDRMGSRAKGPFNLSQMYDSKQTIFGLDVLRTRFTYEKSTLFEGYPSHRPWFPLATDIYQEDIPSMGDMYPYPVKILMLYMSAINYATPAGQTINTILADQKKIPLIISNDILIGETSQYADYIFPDLTFLERWEFHGTHSSVPWKVENIRQPAISIPDWPTVKVYGEEIPLCTEAVMMAIAERLSLPGFGPDGFGEGMPFTRPEHLYLKQVANLAFGEKEDGSDSVPEADPEEIRIFTEARRHLPKTVFDIDVWKAAVGNDDSLWRKMVYVLNRGGRYQDYSKAYKGDLMANAYAKQINLYQEKTATTINTMTGKPFLGYPAYFPPALSSTGEKIQDEGFDLHLITHKMIHMTKARTITNYWLLSLMPEGPLWMSTADADKLGLADGDLVKLVSASNPEGAWDLQDGTAKPMTGKLKVVEGIRPGVVSFGLGYGHWASGARDVMIDGIKIQGDPQRAAGFHGNGAMQIDPYLGNTTLQDIAGGSAVFYDSKVKVVKA
jgi:tetrathionate reductase subunit A